MLRRQKEEQERRQREQQQTEGMTQSSSLDSEQLAEAREMDENGSDCETGLKIEDVEAFAEVREWKVKSAERVPRLP